MAEDRLKELLLKPFSEINEDLWKELQDLISAQTEVEEKEEEEQTSPPTPPTPPGVPA